MIEKAIRIYERIAYRRLAVGMTAEYIKEKTTPLPGDCCPFKLYREENEQ